FQALGHIDLDVVAVAELKLQLPPLRLRAIADAGDFQYFGETAGNAFDQVRHQRPLHAPVAARGLGVVGRLDRDRTVLELVFDEVRQPYRKGALGPLHAERAVLDLGGDPARDLHRLLADAAHQNTSASTSPPTF